jgi:hypothetical protein
MSTSGAMKRRERRREHRGWRAGGGGRARRRAQSEAEAEVTGMRREDCFCPYVGLLVSCGSPQEIRSGVFFSIFFSFCRWKPTLVCIWVLVWRWTLGPGGRIRRTVFLIIFLCVGKYRQEKQVTDKKIGNFSVYNRNNDRKIKLPTENFNYPVGFGYPTE